ncbi:MAG: ABC transporter ATP-binding protein [Candidatus Thermoplasmatota archaeon]
MADEDVLIDIRDLSLHFDTYAGAVKALDGVELAVHRNETLGLVGESGCGKTVTAMTILRLLASPPAVYTGGQVMFRRGTQSDEIDMLRASMQEIQSIRGNEISMIFQEPMTSLNPVMRVGDQIAETMLRHQDLGFPKPSDLERYLESRGWRLTKKLRGRRSEAMRRAAEMLGRIGLADPVAMLERYPHELSGGMRQRIMIAMALSCRPHLLIADEPTTALDVTIQAQIMDLMKELKREEKASILLITHHLGIVAEMCDRVAVMYAGSVVEQGMTNDIFHKPSHPYTVGLLRAIPSLSGPREELPVIPGRIPDLIDPPSGCRFHPRCPYAMPECAKKRPPPHDVGNGHNVACVLYDGTHVVPEALRNAGVREGVA